MKKESKSFEELLERLLPPPDHPLYEQHKRYNIEGVQRGEKIASLMALSGSLSGRKVLDIGCGTGGISVAFARMDAEVCALEPNHTHALLMDLTTARAKKEGVELSTVIGRGEQLPFEDESQDIVLLNAKRPARHFDRSHGECPDRYDNRLVGLVVGICRLPGIRQIVTYLVTRPSLQPGMFEFVISRGEFPESLLEREQGPLRGPA